jgi:hypothetical protein
MLAYITILVLISSMPLVGLFMIYSAIKGKGIEAPDKNASFQIKTQYKLSGVIGLVWFLVGSVILWKFIEIF